MNLSPAWADFLKAAGHKAHFWSSLGLPMSADRSILRYAADQDFVVLTRDLDFGHMLALENHGKPSVIQVRAELAMPDEIGTYVLLVLENSAEALTSGALVTIDTEKVRVRTLPFRVEHS